MTTETKSIPKWRWALSLALRIYVGLCTFLGGMTLSRAFSTVCLGFVIVAAGCGRSADVRAVELKAQALVANRATTNEVASAFGSAPLHIYTRAEVRQYRDRSSPNDSVHKIWSRMLEYPETHIFPMPGGDIQMFFDASGRAAGFYSNIQL